MPDADGNTKGHGWSRAYEDAYARIFGNAASQQLIDPDDFDILPCSSDNEMCRLKGCVPHEPSDEVLAERTAAIDDGWEADNQAARDGYNPAW